MVTMRIKVIGIISWMLLIGGCAWAEDWDEAYLDSIFGDRMLDQIEGVWQFPDAGATIAVNKSTATTFDIYLLDSPRLDIRPGVHIGTAVVTPKRGYYDGTLKSKWLGKHNKLSDEHVTFTVTDEGTFIVKPYKTGYSVSLKRWFYRIFKISLVDNTQRHPTDINGARRIYPYHMSDHYPVCL